MSLLRSCSARLYAKHRLIFNLLFQIIDTEHKTRASRKVVSGRMKKIKTVLMGYGLSRCPLKTLRQREGLQRLYEGLFLSKNS